jgi:hypothetical protein
LFTTISKELASLMVMNPPGDRSGDKKISVMNYTDGQTGGGKEQERFAPRHWTN